MTEPDPDLVVTERAAKLAWWLASGEEITALQAARKLGMTYSGAWRMLNKLERVLPIRYTNGGSSEGHWKTICD